MAAINDIKKGGSDAKDRSPPLASRALFVASFSGSAALLDAHSCHHLVSRWLLRNAKPGKRPCARCVLTLSRRPCWPDGSSVGPLITRSGLESQLGRQVPWH